MPLTTNAIESAFSRLNNRIKRVGRRWSEQGLVNWLKGDLLQDIQTGALINAVERREGFSQD